MRASGERKPLDCSASNRSRSTMAALIMTLSPFSSVPRVEAKHHPDGSIGHAGFERVAGSLAGLPRAAEIRPHACRPLKWEPVYRPVGAGLTRPKLRPKPRALYRDRKGP